MKYFDLHCDTIGECYKQDKLLYENDLHVDIRRAGVLDSYVQCYAAFIPDSLSGDAAFFYFCTLAKRMQEEIERNKDTLVQCRKQGDLALLRKTGKYGAVFTVENGNALGGKLENVSVLREYGVKMMTLTWNGENEIGGGARASGKKGLTQFGKDVLLRLEENDIVADVSHAGERLFADVLSLAKRPVVASHSCAKALCRHPRNLTDRQFLQIKEKKGLVGINFYPPFLAGNSEKVTAFDIFRHAEHFLSLGGEEVVCMGSDFDGAEMPKEIRGIQSIPALYELFLQKNYPETLVKKIFFGNAADFYQRNNYL